MILCVSRQFIHWVDKRGIMPRFINYTSSVCDCCRNDVATKARDNPRLAVSYLKLNIKHTARTRARKSLWWWERSKLCGFAEACFPNRRHIFGDSNVRLTLWDRSRGCGNNIRGYLHALSLQARARASVYTWFSSLSLRANVRLQQLRNCDSNTNALITLVHDSQRDITRLIS